MKITIKKIAEEAGVSVTTVSNVINKKAHRVSQDKIDMIEAIIKKYNYSPNMNARALVKSSSRLIGLLYFSDHKNLDFSDPFVTEVLEGIERVAKAHTFFTLVHSVSETENIAELQNNWKFDGFIAVGFSQELFEEVNRIVQVPIVFIDTHLEERIFQSIEKYPNNYFINTNDRKAAFEAAAYLLEKGKKHIGFLSYAFDHKKTSVIQQRYLGYVEALDRFSIKEDEGLIYTDEDQEQMIADVDKFDALVVTADYLAIKFIHKLKQKHLFYEKKISIISFDDIRYAALNDPPLSTVRLDQIKKGEKAMETLVNIVDNHNEEPQIRLLNGKLIIRKTTF